MGILRVSNSFNFEKKIKSFCQPPRYSFSKLEDGVAILVVHPDASDERMDGHVVMVRYIDDIVQFSIASHIMIAPGENIPHHLSTTLLKINSDSLMGFWSLERMDDNPEIAFVFSYNNNVSKMLLNKKLFDEVITDMFDSCSDLYQMIDAAEQAYKSTLDTKSNAENGEHHEH